MKYNFDTTIARENTNSTKWDPAIFKKMRGFDGDSILPMWIADMDFRAPEVILDALKTRVDHGIFGYSSPLEDYYAALSWWQKSRHDWEIKEEWVTITPGIVPALNFIIRALSNEGDQVIIQEPVYSPFRSTVENNNRVVANNPLLLVNGNYEMNYDQLERLASNPLTKLLILCSPHNPMGMVWSSEQLRRLGKICNANDVIVISDEIHNDLIMSGHKHMTYALLGEEFANNAVICTAPSKTFNIAGLQTSNIIIPNPDIKEKIDLEIEKSSLTEQNLFGIVATTAAYSEKGAEWLDQLLTYLESNADFIDQFVKERMPNVKFIKPQATYLAWLDFKETAIYEDLDKKILEEAKVWLNNGAMFGLGGEGYMRINFACPRSILAEALERIAKLFE
ncbi:MalY/PatB family protein [Paenibacillus macquariensis]|uniref:cysteine-S-conjugate beta-lyase n=1 Tax=Paenibacillus macquariensis TaxID=948756 RepID=A0ABY1K412_9BACL|nr:MalY/PatB family protein [Paenibacillus macquariensis]MEC0088920.1 pyridoxal phosphate-dependent aminotransferase [Paenibacillus macquariensis]OAB31935.1 cystathionine beta-lyase [Paenibacillus macquariensis subsp. macquariensis]SIR22706.1 cystathione beta-lyase [Paenibacillus macquariensis]